MSLPAELPGRLRCQLRLVLAESLLRLGDAAEGKALCEEAAEIAEQVGADDLLARAALVYGTELATGLVDPKMVSLLRKALAGFDDGDSPMRARLMTRLAAALTPASTPQEASEVLALMRASTAMARRIGDRHTLLYVLQFAGTVGFLVPEDERLSFMRETVELATALGQPLVLLHTLPGYITTLLACGQRAEAEAVLPGYEALVAEYRQPLHLVRMAIMRALFRALEGDFDEADRLGAEARVLAERAGSRPGLALWIAQRLTLALMRGRPDLLARDGEQLLAYFGSVPSIVPYDAWILAGNGRREEALERLSAVDQSRLSLPPLDLMALLGTAETCVQLGDAELARTLYPRLLEATDRMFWGLAPGCLIGPTGRTLGELAVLAGRVPDALRHHDRAIAFCEKLGAPALVARCRQSREAALVGASPLPVAPVAEPLGGTPPDLELRREGDVWVIATRRSPPFRLKHAKGFEYLRYLVEQPGRQVHVLELAGVEHQAGDAGPGLDARAKAEYRERLDDLREELAEAERFGDPARVRRREAEIEAIAEQLAGAVGLGGRDRRAASDVERTRINVQRRLKNTIERIAAVDPPLGRYLAAAVRTGTYCAYLPL